MSVAFRRESDEEHREPKFELPIPAGPNLVTARGLRLIQARVAALAAEIDASEGDAKAALERDLRYWNTRMTTAQIAPEPTLDRVAFGTRVTLCLNGARRTIEIVGGDEAEPARDHLAFFAPLARAVLGAEVDDLLPFNGVADAIEILSIDRIGAHD